MATMPRHPLLIRINIRVLRRCLSRDALPKLGSLG
jgi:hypothetical protein